MSHQAESRRLGCPQGSGRVVWLNRLDRPGRSPPGEVTTGSCAMGAREPGQDREVAAFIGIARVPQIAWSSPQPAGDRPAARTAARSARPASSGAPISLGDGGESRRSGRSSTSRRHVPTSTSSSTVAILRNRSANSIWLRSVAASCTVPRTPGTSQSADRRRDVLEVAVPGEHPGRALGAPAGQAREPVGRVADEAEVVGDRRRADAELLDHPGLVDDLALATVELHDPGPPDALTQVLVGRDDEHLLDPLRRRRRWRRPRRARRRLRTRPSPSGRHPSRPARPRGPGSGAATPVASPRWSCSRATGRCGSSR